MSSAPAIETRNVSLAFDEKQVLRDVSIRLGTAETLVLLGVTGSGKSVLLKLLMGLLKPDSGRVLVEGRDITPLEESDLRPVRRRMGIVFQEGALFDSLSVHENVAYGLREAGRTDEEGIARLVREVLQFVAMEDAIEKMPSELSGGMQRRVSVARAIVTQPAIMLYDSPTAGLDPITSHTIIILIAKLRDMQQVSSVVVTQRVQDAFVLANFVYSPDQQDLIPAAGKAAPPPHAATRFLVLRDGEVYFQGTPDEFVRSQDTYLREFLA